MAYTLPVNYLVVSDDKSVEKGTSQNLTTGDKKLHGIAQ